MFYALCARSYSTCAVGLGSLRMSCRICMVVLFFAIGARSFQFKKRKKIIVTHQGDVLISFLVRYGRCLSSLRSQAVFSIWTKCCIQQLLLNKQTFRGEINHLFLPFDGAVETCIFYILFFSINLKNSTAKLD